LDTQKGKNADCVDMIKENSIHIVCDRPVLACKIYRILGYIFLKPEDLKKVRVSSLLSLVANTGLGLIS
jgi:hypothetical protein